MKSRSLKAAMLIIALGAVGLGLLLSPLTHDAHAYCNLCESYAQVAKSLCNVYGESNRICELAWQYYWICEFLAHYTGN